MTLNIQNKRKSVNFFQREGCVSRPAGMLLKAILPLTVANPRSKLLYLQNCSKTYVKTKHIFIKENSNWITGQQTRTNKSDRRAPFYPWLVSIVNNGDCGTFFLQSLSSSQEKHGTTYIRLSIPEPACPSCSPSGTSILSPGNHRLQTLVPGTINPRVVVMVPITCVGIFRRHCWSKCVQTCAIC